MKNIRIAALFGMFLISSLIVSGCSSQTSSDNTEPENSNTEVNVSETNKDDAGSGVLAFTNALLIDGTGNQPIENATVILKDNMITEAGEDISIPEGSVVVNLKGKTLMPGLIESHLHLGGVTEVANPEDITSGKLFGGSVLTSNYADVRESSLKNGVTTIRSLGDYLDDSLQIRDKVNNGELRGPRIIVSGPSFQMKDGHPGSTVWGSVPETLSQAARTPTTGEEAKEMVKELADAGVDCIKVIVSSKSFDEKGSPTLSFDIVGAIIEEAHKYNLSVATHTENPYDALEAVKQGSDSIEHFLEDDYSSYPDEIYEEVFGLMAEKGTFLTPTVVINSQYDLGAIYKKAYDAGVRITVGTDSGAPNLSHGSSLHAEMESLVNTVGIPALEVIKAATQTNAEMLGISDIVGTVEKGKVADLLIVNGNPAEDISATQNIEMVIKDGKVVIDNMLSK